MSKNNTVRVFYADATGFNGGTAHRYARGLVVEKGDPRGDAACAAEIATVVACKMAALGYSEYSMSVNGPVSHEEKG